MRILSHTSIKLASVITAIVLVFSLSACSPTDVAISRFPPSQHINARCIIHYESGGNPGARSRTNDYGLFQINAVHAGEFRQVTGKPFFNGVYDADANGQYARYLWDKQGWRPWSARKKCGL